MFLPEHTAGVNASVSAGAYFTDDVIDDSGNSGDSSYGSGFLVLILLELIFLVVATTLWLCCFWCYVVVLL